MHAGIDDSGNVDFPACHATQRGEHSARWCVCVCVMFVWRIFAANPYSIMLFYTIVRVNKTVGN